MTLRNEASGLRQPLTANALVPRSVEARRGRAAVLTRRDGSAVEMRRRARGCWVPRASVGSSGGGRRGSWGISGVGGCARGSDQTAMSGRGREGREKRRGKSRGSGAAHDGPGAHRHRPGEPTCQPRRQRDSLANVSDRVWSLPCTFEFRPVRASPIVRASTSSKLMNLNEKKVQQLALNTVQ
jgi:hypothetical protein